jgi:hypothetical protein
MSQSYERPHEKYGLTQQRQMGRIGEYAYAHFTPILHVYNYGVVCTQITGRKVQGRAGHT